MELDYNCVRDLLLFLESELELLDTGYGFEFNAIYFDDVARNLKKYRKEVIAYTTLKLDEAGYVNVDCEYGDECYHNFTFYGITYEGHQYLDSIKSESIWSKILSKSKEKGLSLTFDVIKALATTLVTSALM